MQWLRTSTRRLVVAALFAVGALLVSPAVQAQTILTVGPDGTYPDIQNAIDVVVNGANTEIRIQGGDLTYNENLTVPNSFTSGTLEISGGWDASFTGPHGTPETTVDGGGSRVFDITPGGGTVQIADLIFTGGGATQGAGLFVAPVGDATLEIRDCIIAENVASAPGDTLGGGLWAILSGSQHLEIDRCGFFGNLATSSGGGLANSGGLGIIATDSATILIRETQFFLNHVGTTGSDSSAAGLLLELSDSVEADLEDCLFAGNNGINNQNFVPGAGAWIATQGSAVVRAPRNVWSQNEGAGPAGSSQLHLSNHGQTSMDLREAGIVQGDSDGLVVDAEDTCTVHLTNLTVDSHPGIGVTMMEESGTGAATLTLYNTIIYNSGTDLSTTGTVDTGFNLIGTDPLFLDPANFDYRLAIGSPAENTGTNTPPGGLSSIDMDGNPRIEDGVVDKGALEGIAEIFSDGFESNDTLAWSATQP